MKMQIPQLRQLFEARVGQIASVLAEDPPPELGSVEPTMRGLKGFLFTLEGMMRKDELQCLPFTARQDLFDRVEQATKAIETLPELLDRDQALGVLRVMDNLYRLCLQENLMASGLDASKLGKLTVILERKLGDVLETIDGVAETGLGRAREIEQAARGRLAEIEGVYKKETEVLAGSASLAAESIRSQSEVIRKRQAEAMGAIDKLQQELSRERERFQGKLDEQLAAVQRVMDEARGEQQAVQGLLARAREQLGEAQTAITAMTEVTETTETAREDLQAKLSEGREVVGSIRELLAGGTQVAAEVSAKVAEAEQSLASIQQTAHRCAELSDGTGQKQEQALAAVRATTQAAEHLQAEARRKLDDQLQAAAQVLAGIESNGEAAADTLTQMQQRHQAAGEAGQAIDAAGQVAVETCRQAQEELAQLRALVAQGEQTAGQLDELAQAGDDLKARMARTLTEAGESRERIEQFQSDVSEAVAAIRQQKEETLEAGRDAAAETERRHRQYELAVSEQTEAARDAVARLRGDQAIAADLLGRTRQDIEAIQGEIRQIHELRAAAGDAQGDLRAKLDQAGSVVEELGGVLAEAGELRTQVEGHLAGSSEARGQLEHLARDTAAFAEDLRHRQTEALAAVRSEAEAAQAQRKACEASFTEQLESSRAAVRSEAEAARAQRKACEASFTEQLESSRAAVRSEAEAAQAQRKACEASFTEQLESARAVVADLHARKETIDGLLEQTQQQRDAARAAGQETAAVRVTTAEAAGEVQGKLQEARRGTADLAGLLSAATDSRSKIDTELAAASRAAGEVGNIRRELGEFFDHVQQHRGEMAEAKTQSQQFIADFRSDGREALDRLAEQNTDLVARNEQLRQDLEDILGQAVDGGIFRQFDDLAEQSAPRRAKWLRLLIGSGAGGAVVLAAASSILTAVSPWAAAAVLLAGLVPLSLFLYFCASQYNAERRAEAQYRYRAALSRSLTAYRKLLATMKAEGIADSAFVDRMLSALFGETAAPDEPAPTAPARAAGQPDARTDADQDEQQPG